VRRRLRRVRRGVQYVVAWSDVARYVRRCAPDALIVGNLAFGVDGVAAWWLGRPRVRLGFRWRDRSWTLVQLAHTPAPLSWRSAPGSSLYKRGRVLDAAIGRAYRRIDIAVVLGMRSRDELLARWPVTGDVLVIPHGPSDLVSAPLRPADGTDPAVLFFGTWSRYKGLDVLLDAWASVTQRLPGASLVVAGAPTKDVDLAAIQTRAANLSNIELRPGYVPLEEVSRLMGDARLIVLPYRAANQSGVVGLAQRASRPVVATLVGDLPDHVRDGETGLLVAPEDPAALADALVVLLRDATAAGRMGDAAYADSQLRGGWDEAAARLEDAVTRSKLRPDSPSDTGARAAPPR
jgi:glycosyltransferase involved in cell wall biosynthesis